MKAGNAFGYGKYSDPIKVKAAGVPKKVQMANTRVDEETGDVVVEWTAPHDGGSAITGYRVRIADKTEENWISYQACPGTDPAVLSCTIKMAALKEEPYNYEFEQIVKVKVSAINEYGVGEPSVPNTQGADIRR